jgi:hypothetical protein
MFVCAVKLKPPFFVAVFLFLLFCVCVFQVQLDSIHLVTHFSVPFSLRNSFLSFLTLLRCARRVPI